MKRVFDFFFCFFPLSGCLSRNNDHFLAIRQKSGKPAFIYHHSQDIEKSLDIAPQKTYKHNYHSSSEAQIGKHHQIVNSAFPKPAYDTSLNLLATAGQDLEVENRPVPAANVIVVVSIAFNWWCWRFPLWLMLSNKWKLMVTSYHWISVTIYHSISYSLVFPFC